MRAADVLRVQHELLDRGGVARARLPLPKSEKSHSAILKKSVRPHSEKSKMNPEVSTKIHDG